MKCHYSSEARLMGFEFGHASLRQPSWDDQIYQCIMPTYLPFLYGNLSSLGSISILDTRSRYKRLNFKSLVQPVHLPRGKVNMGHLLYRTAWVSRECFQTLSRSLTHTYRLQGMRWQSSVAGPNAQENTQEKHGPGALDGLKVLDLSRVLAVSSHVRRAKKSC